ncbi:hypothetical protein OXX80_010503 [Metschnikowia pulcherrima]
MTKQRQRYSVALTCFLVVLIFLYSELRHHSSGRHMPSYVKSEKADSSMKLQFPASFSKDISKRDLIKNSAAFKVTGFRYDRIIQPGKPTAPSRKSTNLWAISMLRIFGFGVTIGLNLDRCNEALVSKSTVLVSPKKNLNTPLTNIVARMIREIDRGRDPYMREFKPYLDPQIRLQVEYGVVDKHWFNMAGSSVYLKEYGLHMMVSRLAYSPDGSRNNPKFSFAYTQLFDVDWNEVNDMALIVPTNMNDGDRFFTVEGKNYTIAHYPSILPVPFYHDYNDPGMKYLGPEDARVILVQNEAGHEEPLIVYNLHHQKQILLDDDEDDYILKQMAFFRSMWVSWPWQFQRGKYAIEDTKNELFDNRIYNRAKELQIKNTQREKTQKNWTPFVSESARSDSGFDKHLFFVYRWSHLQVLKCDITSDTGKCGFTYTVQENLRVTSKIGPLRGGTPMVSLNSVIGARFHHLLPEMIPEGREIWVGFARAHLWRCGCGNDFYRPNLVVLVKDTANGEKSADSYRLSYISSFTPLGVDAIPWDPLRPLDICKGTNAVIPNGISQWDAHSVRESAGNWAADDTLSLALSVSDCTVDVVHVQGVLNTLLNMRGRLLTLPPAGNPNRDVSREKVKKGMSMKPSNDNIVCAMEESTKFCAFYGENVETRKKMAEIYEEEYETVPEDENLELYRFAVEQLVSEQ